MFFSLNLGFLDNINSEFQKVWVNMNHMKHNNGGRQGVFDRLDPRLKNYDCPGLEKVS